MLTYATGVISSLLLEGEKVVLGHEMYSMTTFMALFLLITIEVVVMKVVTSEMEDDDDNYPGLSAAATFFDRED